MRIGILEDDASLARELSELLGAAGHHCYFHQWGESLLGFLSRETVDVLLLDWNVSGTHTGDVIRRVREENPFQPPIVVFVTRIAEQDIIAALRCGADGYALKPLQPAVLLARIEGLYERWYPKSRTRIEHYGGYLFDTETETVAIHGSPVPMTSKEFALSLMFFRNQNRTLSRSYIFEALWAGNPELQTRTVDSHVSKVRSKLDLRGAEGFHLVPVYGFGYRLKTTQRHERTRFLRRA
jgi:DNA-binding response OmpR family regulator